MSRSRVHIPPPKQCPACEGSSGGVCANHRGTVAAKKGTPSHDRVLWDEADSAERDADTWEATFLESVGRFLDLGHTLTRKQRIKLAEIHERLTK